MHEDLLRRALESKKTTSRKAAFRQASNVTSPVSSRLQSPLASKDVSRAASRQGSDEEVDDDVSLFSEASMIKEQAELEEALNTRSWEDILEETIESITNDRTRSQATRERDLHIYIHLLREHFCQDEIAAALEELQDGFIKSSKSHSDVEAIAALKALQITVVTEPNSQIYETGASLLKDLIARADSFAVRAEAIRALSVIAFYSADEDEEITQAVMDYLMSIISSDACNIGADEDATIVLAALESWGFLSTQIEDMSETSQEAIEAFYEQLHSSDPLIQIACGQNVCLVYEKSWTPIEEGEEVARPVDSHSGDPLPYFIKRYDPYRQKHELEELIEGIAKDSHKSVNKKIRRELHQNFADFLQGIEAPYLGPRFRTFLVDRDGEQKPLQPINSTSSLSRPLNAITVTVKTSSGPTRHLVTKWWMLSRVREMQRILKHGFADQYALNEAIEETIPFGVEPLVMPWGTKWT